MVVPSSSRIASKSTFQINRILALVVLVTTLVIVNVSASGENEQHLYYKELERLRQMKPSSNAKDHQQTTIRHTSTYQYPQQHHIQPLQSFTNILQQQQRQEPLNLQHHRILKIENTKYTVWIQNLTYASSVDYNALGMAPLYNITNKVIDLFVDHQPIPDGYLVVTERKISAGPNVENNDWGDLLKKYWAIITVVLICVLTAVLMPIIGLCFCCCRCAGACGGRSQPFDKKHDTCRRFFLGFFLIVVASAMVFGVIVTFVTNSTLQHGVDNITLSARDGVDDTRKYLKSTAFHMRHLLVDNYKELEKNLNKTLEETAETVVTQLETTSKAVSLKQLNNFVSTLPLIKSDMEKMTLLRDALQLHASQLNDGLRGVQRELLDVFRVCGDACAEIDGKFPIGQLSENEIEYDKLPDIQHIIDDVNRLTEGDLGKAITDAESAVDTIRQDIEKVINDNLPDVKKSIADVGVAIQAVSDDITQKIEQIADVAGNNTYKHFETADEYIKQYSIYRYYAGLGIASVLLIVLLFVTFGLICGICGKRPDGYGDDCCTKGAGSRFLMCGVAMIFLTISVLLVVSLAFFLVGVIFRRGACDTLRSPADDPLFNYVDNFIDLNYYLYPEQRQSTKQRKGNAGKSPIVTKQSLTPFRISEVIEACHQNGSIFQVLRLESLVKMEEIRDYPKTYKITEKLDNLVHDMEVTPDIIIVNSETIAELDDLAKSELGNFDADKFTDNLQGKITMYSLTELANQLESAANLFQVQNEQRARLLNQALMLRTYQSTLVDPMTKNTNELMDMTKNLEKSLKFNSTTFSEAINEFKIEIMAAEAFFKQNGTLYVRQVAQELVTGFLNDIDEYLNLVTNTTEKDIGRCGPISNVYSSLLVATCNRVVDPFNGFWAGLAWCLLLFFPTIILSAKLSTLYQKSDPWPGAAVEAEYLYDAYSERDNIPLANGPKNKRRRKNDRRHDSRDTRRGEYYEESSPTTASSHQQRDTRFTDMAPKNWDGAPPRYNPPMAPPTSSMSEYERPPPYYYPGQSEHE